MLSRDPLRFLALGSVLAALAGCSGKVVVVVGGSGGATTTGTGGSGGCGGETFGCLQFCGSDFFPANAACVNGAWQCPPGTVDPKTCQPIGCPELPTGPCDACVNGGWVCDPTPECLASCPAMACVSCDGFGVATPACSCSCDANGMLACAPTTGGCCKSDWDCGDEWFVPCVNGVCKQPVSDGCWSNEECNGLSCVGAFVCPCGADCDQPDHPGFCEGPP